MKFITIGCLAALFSVSYGLKVNKSHKQEGVEAANVKIDDAKQGLKEQYKENLVEMKNQFEQVDKDGDGTWTKEEFDAFSKGVTAEERDKSWAEFDANGDGQVPNQEFKTSIKKNLKETVNAEVDKMKSADTDGDGAISAEEAAAVPGGLVVAPESSE